jgi:pSer/pThr/pTyr-binding forkhead associated (FHA) protein
MVEPVSVGLKFAFLVVLYLFLMWVAWSAVRDLRRGRGSVADADRQPPDDATGMYDAVEPLVDPALDAEPRLLVERVPGQEAGTAYSISDRGLRLGRGDVEVHLDDPFASSQHARISVQGHVVVIEDLGSTNGTYLNDELLTGPQPLHDGDRIRIGDSEFSYLR